MKKESDISYFEIQIPIKAQEFINRVVFRIKTLDPKDSKRFFSGLTIVDYRSIDLYENKIVVWKHRKLLNEPSNIGTGKIEITFKDSDSGTLLIGKIIVNGLPIEGAIAIVIFFAITGLSIGAPIDILHSLKYGFISSLFGGAIALISLMLKKDYCINVRSYGMNFIKDVMREH
jgi:hypothetical protein